jgi:hypothetical protein
MAITVQTAAARVQGTGSPTVTTTTDSFTPAAGELMVAVVVSDTSGAASANTSTCSDTQGETWALRTDSWGGTGGLVQIWTVTATAATARTVTVVGDINGANVVLQSLQVYLVAGQHASPIGQVNEGTSSANAITPTLWTSTVANAFAFVAAVDWNALGAPSSSDLTAVAFHAAGNISGLHGYKDCGSTGSETANIDGSGTSAADWHWCSLEILPAGAAAAGGLLAARRPARGLAMRGKRLA